MADDDLAALERAERDACDEYWRCSERDDARLRAAWLDARSALNRARISLARRDG